MTYVDPSKGYPQDAQQFATTIDVDSEVAANGNGTPLSVAGYNGGITLQARNTAGGSCTIAVEGTLDSANNAADSDWDWESVRFYQIGVGGTLTPAVAAVALAATSQVTLAILDSYATLRFVVGGKSGTISVDTRAFVTPL